METNLTPNVIEVCKILSQCDINPSLPNNIGETPRYSNDVRYEIMKEAIETFQKEHGSNKDTECEITPQKSHAEQILTLEKIVEECTQMLVQLSKEEWLLNLQSSDYSKKESEQNQDNPKVIKSMVVSPQERNMSPTAAYSKQPCGSAKLAKDAYEITFDFEGSTWEVECTSKVKKKFFDDKKVPRHEKKNVVETIKKLMNGIPITNKNLCKEVKAGSKLFEARYSDSSRILYEIAKQFSPRHNCYSEVIRVWDIVRDHDNLARSIEQVHKSQKRGKEAAHHIRLRKEDEKFQQSSTQSHRLPKRYTVCTGSNEKKGSKSPPLFIPAGSTKNDEHSVITFYSFDSLFVKSMLDGENARRDFPFKGWPEEHKIINMPQGEVSILLLGRSGTGKTTCCLYRLWNQFQAFWMKILPATGPLWHEDNPELSDTKLTNQGGDADLQSGSNSYEESDAANSTSPLQQFHQVFITKNHVLCDQMKRRFYGLMAGNEIFTQHMAYEDAELPSRLSEIEDLSFPLFLTARQFFILLDNSLQDNKAFFARDSEGRLTEKIVNSDYGHEDPDTLLDLEESDSENEVDLESDSDDEIKTEKKVLIEMTPSYFAKEVWPRIKHDSKIDPLLVWMEIKSFIKGSLLAVQQKEGFLSQEKYKSLGKKNVDEESDIYKIFTLYQKISRKIVFLMNVICTTAYIHD